MRVTLLIIFSICAVQLTACSKKTDRDSLSTSESIKFLNTVDKSDYIELFPDGTVIRNRTLGPTMFTGKYIGEYTVDGGFRIVVKYVNDQSELFVHNSERNSWGEGSDIPYLYSVDRQIFTPEGLRKTYIKNNIIYYAEDEEEGTVQDSKSQQAKKLCMHNLRQIGMGLRMYADEHNGRLPKTLDQLLYDYISIEEVFVCPSDITPKNTGKDLVTSYKYIYTNKLTPQTILVYDQNPQVHGEQGRNVLFGDWHTEWISEKDFMKWLR